MVSCLCRTDKQTRLQPIQGVVLKVNVSAFKTPLPCKLSPFINVYCLFLKTFSLKFILRIPCMSSL